MLSLFVIVESRNYSARTLLSLVLQLFFFDEYFAFMTSTNRVVC